MLTSETIVCVSTHSWSSLQQNRQQIMRRLAINNRVVFLEPQRDPSLTFVGNLKTKIRNIFYLRVNTLSPTLFVVAAPPAIPFGAALLPKMWSGCSTSWIAKVNCQILAMIIRRIIRRFGIAEPILWLSSPWQEYLMRKCPKKLVCYEVYDEISQYPNNAKVQQEIETADRRLSRQADLIVATSKAQMCKRKRLNPHTYFVPNAVDFELFNQALRSNIMICDELKGIQRPRIGYVGLLSFQFDVDLLLHLAKKKPQWEFVLVGPDGLGTDRKARSLRSQRNVHFLGLKPMKELPGILKGLDVAIMPYDLSTHVATSYPTKLHEYLAAGKPTVSVNMCELKPFRDVIYLSQSVEEFSSNIQLALEENRPDEVQRRIEVARKNTWDDRVKRISGLLEKRLLDKSQK